MKGALDGENYKQVLMDGHLAVEESWVTNLPRANAVEVKGDEALWLNINCYDAKS